MERGLRYPDHIKFLPEITAMILDNHAFVLCSRGDTDRNILGDLSAYGSVSVIRRIRSEIADPDKYGDVMLELTYATWHISRGHQVQPTDEQGTADFQVVIPGCSLPVYTECKRIRKDTNDSRFGDVIRKANRQIKTSSRGKDCLGLVAIDISDKVEPPREVSDEFPSEVQRLSSVIQDTLKEHNTSVSAIVLFWNEFSMLGGPPEQPRSHIALVRRTHLIRHMQPRKSLPDSSVLSEIGNTVEFNVYWRERSN